MTHKIPLAVVIACLLVAGAGCAEDDPDPITPASTGPAPAAESLALPDGLPEGRIAFRRFLDQAQTTAALFTMSTDGSGEEQITHPPEGARDALPDWSPDGASLAFQREFSDKPYEVYVVGADGRGEHPIVPDCPAYVGKYEICEETGPAWSPDGSRLAFSWPQGAIRQVNGEDIIEVRGIAVMGTDGSAPRLLTHTERPTSAEDETPVWSPDGSQIAFIRLNVTADPVDKAAVFVMNTDGTNVRQITPWRLRAADIDWAPDGSLISFRSEETAQDNIGDIYTVRPDGSHLTRLTDNQGTAEVYASSFSPDSEWLVFAMTGVGGLPDLYVIRTDGTDLGQLTTTPAYESAPDWSPR